MADMAEAITEKETKANQIIQPLQVQFMAAVHCLPAAFDFEYAILWAKFHIYF